METINSIRSISKETYKNALNELLKFKLSSPIANYTAKECLGNILDILCIDVEED